MEHKNALLLPAVNRRNLRRVALIAALLIAGPYPATACDVAGPAMLSLYLAGRENDAALREEEAKIANSSGAAGVESKALAELDAALNALNTQVWGLYWVSLYSRRLHEVLDQLDSKPPGPVTNYYEHWDQTQLSSSAALTLREAGAVDQTLSRAGSVSAELGAKLRQYLEHIGKDLQGCSSGH